MTDNTTITDEQATAMREQLARYEAQKAYEAALKRHALYLVLKPLVESDAFMDLHQQMKTIQTDGPTDDYFFAMGLNTAINGMESMGIHVANWTAPIDPNAPVVTPTPAPEGNNDGATS